MRGLLKLAILTLPIFAILFFSTGCDKSFEQGARENTAAFFRTVSRKQRSQTADPDNLSRKPISILDDRLVIQMPEGAKKMTRSQGKALGERSSSNPIAEEFVVWGGSGEVLTLRISEQFSSSEQINLETARYLMTYKTWMDQVPFKVGDHAVAISLPLEKIARSREGELEFMRAMVFGGGNTLISIEFSLYTTAFDRLEERIAFFQEVAISIIKSATPGTRILGAEEQEINFEQFVFKIPAGYYVTLNQPEQVKSNGSTQNARVDIDPIVPMESVAAFFTMEIGDDLAIMYPEFVSQSREDTLLNQSIIWQRQQGTMPSGYEYDFWETVVPVGWKKSLKVSLYPQQENDFEELLKILHTLEKK